MERHAQQGIANGPYLSDPTPNSDIQQGSKTNSLPVIIAPAPAPPTPGAGS